MSALVEQIYACAKNALLDLFRNGESFYYCVLVTTEEGHAPFVSAWSKEALERESGKSEESKEYFSSVKWSYADSPYVAHADDSFQPVKELFAKRPSIDDLDAEAWLKELQERVTAMEDALKKLDADGLFSSNQPRSDILINVEITPPDYSNTERAIVLNAGRSNALAAWLEEAAERG